MTDQRHSTREHLDADDVVVRLLTDTLRHLDDTIDVDDSLCAGIAMVLDDGEVVLASTDERARRLGRLQFSEQTGPGPSCLATRRPSGARPVATSSSAELERELGITHRLAVPIEVGTDAQPPAILTCWSTNGPVDEGAIARTATDIATLVQRAHDIRRSLQVAADLESQLRSTDADGPAVACGILMEDLGVDAAAARRELVTRARAAGRSVDAEARALLASRRDDASSDAR